MSNFHKDLDEANKHEPKGWTAAVVNTFPIRNENNESTYEENFTLPRAINFVDGTVAAPTSADGDIYVLTGSGTLDASWGTLAAFGDWVRAKSSAFVPITPQTGTLCYDDTASTWMEFNGSVWAAFGGVGVTNLGVANITATNLDVTSDTGTDATLPAATASDAGLMTGADKTKLNGIATSANNYSHPNHSGEVTSVGDGVQTLDPTAISNKAVVTADGADYFLIGDTSDSNNLKKALVSDVLGGGNTIYSGDDTLAGNRVVSYAGASLSFNDGQTNFKGGGSTSGTTALLVENQSGTDLLEVKDDGTSLFSSFVGIGTTSPSYRLHVNGTGSNEIIRLSKSGVTQADLGYYTSGGYLWLNDVAGTNKVKINAATTDFIDTGKNFGLGTQSPAHKLHVNDTVGNGIIRLSKSGVTQSDLGYYTSGGYLWLNDVVGTAKVKINATTVDFIDTGKNFGLGIQAPTAKLHVSGTVQLEDGSEGTVGHSWISTGVNGEGNWSDIHSTIQLSSTMTYLGANNMRTHQEVIGGIGRITWEGNTGAILTLIDDPDSDIFTASDVSGNPIVLIDADWNVKLGNPFNRPFEIRYDSLTAISYTKFKLPDYANDAAADADASLLSGESYTTSAVDRTIKIKP